MEGNGDVLRGFSSGKESDSERVILQVALCITRLFRYSTTGQSNNPRSNPFLVSMTNCSGYMMLLSMHKILFFLFSDYINIIYMQHRCGSLASMQPL